MHSEQATLEGPQHPAPQVQPATTPRVIRDLLQRADVRINGPRPWDMQVRKPRLWRRVLAHWSLGLGEAYMDGDWDCERLDMLFHRLLLADVENSPAGLARWRLLLETLRQRLLNLQTPQRAAQVGEKHYDAGNDVFKAMLDPAMIYSCAYWERADNLAQAQQDKLALICRKLQLQPGDRLLDIGCGWGGLARYAAEHHAARVTGVTVSKEQLALAQDHCRGWPVTLMLADYRSLDASRVGRFDKVVSVGMFEHVGPKNYAAYFDTVLRLLEPQGLFLLHTIGIDRTRARTDPWIDRYVFPNGKLPSALELARSMEGRFIIEDWHNFGADYDRTLMSWHANFEAAWPQLAARYSERFHRMWRYYLMCCAGFFRSRQGQLWQLVLTTPQRETVYRSVRLAG